MVDTTEYVNPGRLRSESAGIVSFWTPSHLSYSPSESLTAEIVTETHLSAPPPRRNFLSVFTLTVVVPCSLSLRDPGTCAQASDWKQKLNHQADLEDRMVDEGYIKMVLQI